MSSVFINGIEKKLSKKEEQFCQQYLLDFNGARAAREAGYSEESAASIGSQNLRKIHIQVRIAELRKDDAERLNITKERILQEYAKLAFSNIQNAFDANGNIKPISEIDPATAAAICSVESDEIVSVTGDDGEKKIGGVTRKVKFWNKADGLAGLTKMLGYNAPEQLETTIKSAVVKIGGKKISDE